ncbi:nitroreductase family protein [Candidatus Poriferisocius sp.]|uniref:nitroreductase family protein n=1 Tax=Candidatus Poriferisocius sp. TaxID=3101276 RepID=UPI003B0225B3
MTPFDTDAIDRLLSTTRSVRRRLDFDRAVDPNILRDCVTLAAYAPNASNAQDWRWLIVTDPEPRAAIAEVYRAGIVPPMHELLDRRRADGDPAGVRHSEAVLYLAERFHEVPALVIPCIRGQLDPELDLAWTASLFGSILPAVWNFQLALHSRGLASTFTTAHLLAAGEVAALLNIPDDYLQTCLIPVAYLRGDDLKPPARKDPDEIIAWNTWT